MEPLLTPAPTRHEESQKKKDDALKKAEGAIGFQPKVGCDVVYPKH